MGETASAPQPLPAREEALRERVIGQAIGRLMERLGVAEEEALELLGGRASDLKIQLVHLARHVSETGDLL